jgi:hypothetical protein
MYQGQAHNHDPLIHPPDMNAQCWMCGCCNHKNTIQISQITSLSTYTTLPGFFSSLYIFPPQFLPTYAFHDAPVTNLSLQNEILGLFSCITSYCLSLDMLNT